MGVSEALTSRTQPEGCRQSMLVLRERKDHQQNQEMEFQAPAQMSDMSLPLTFPLDKENQVAKPGVNRVGNTVLQTGLRGRGNKRFEHYNLPPSPPHGTYMFSAWRSLFTCRAGNTEGQGCDPSCSLGVPASGCWPLGRGQLHAYTGRSDETSRALASQARDEGLGLPIPDLVESHFSLLARIVVAQIK